MRLNETLDAFEGLGRKESGVGNTQLGSQRGVVQQGDLALLDGPVRPQSQRRGEPRDPRRVLGHEEHRFPGGNTLLRELHGRKGLARALVPKAQDRALTIDAAETFVKGWDAQSYPAGHIRWPSPARRMSVLPMDALG